jgi:hypothetical protein
MRCSGLEGNVGWVWGIQQGQGGGRLGTDSNSKRLEEANREGAGVGLGLSGLGVSCRRPCCVCLLGLVRGRAKMEGATDMVNKGRDQEKDREAW